MWVAMVMLAALCVVLAAGCVALGGLAQRRGRETDRAVAVASAYRLSFDHALVGLAVLRYEDGDWDVEHANPALVSLLCRDVEGLPWADLVAPQDRADAAGTLDGLAAGRLPAWQGEHTVEVSGQQRRVHVSMAVLPQPAVTPRLAVQVLDVTARASEQERLRDLALHDPLTGLPNRTLLGDRLELALAGSRRTGGRVLVAFCDLDDFKTVNDTLGHATGDHVLVTVATRLREAVRPADTVARVGGDEFVVLCPDVPDEAVAREIAGRLLTALRTPVEVDDLPVHRGGSIGVALSAPSLPTASVSASALLHAADVAMYRAKRSGKDGVHLLAPADALVPGPTDASQDPAPARDGAGYPADGTSADGTSADSTSQDPGDPPVIDIRITA